MVERWLSWLFGEVEIIFHGANLEQDESQKMMLSADTIEGIHITGTACVKSRGRDLSPQSSAHLPTSPSLPSFFIIF